MSLIYRVCNLVTFVYQVTIRKLWFDQTIKEAVDEARIHHQITPMHVEYEFGVTEVLIDIRNRIPE